MTISRFSMYAASALVLSLAFSSAVSAQSATSGKASSTKGNATSSASMAKDKGNATSSGAKNKTGTTTASSTNGELHRSTVASFVQNLLRVADRQPGIGEQVREIARAQNDEGSTTAQALKAAESRSPIATLLVGSDYKNLGVIRKALATNESRIEKLTALRDDTFNLIDRQTLTDQIDLLKAEDAKLEAFIKTHESKFSVFGWFAKLFQN